MPSLVCETEYGQVGSITDLLLLTCSPHVLWRVLMNAITPVLLFKIPHDSWKDRVVQPESVPLLIHYMMNFVQRQTGEGRSTLLPLAPWSDYGATQ